MQTSYVMTVVSGSEEMVGANGVAMLDFDSTGTVFVHSESWQARTSSPLKKDQPVRVTGLDGLVLDVEPAAEEHNKNQENPQGEDK